MNYYILNFFCKITLLFIFTYFFIFLFN